jgi:hypothetical protein
MQTTAPSTTNSDDSMAMSLDDIVPQPKKRPHDADDQFDQNSSSFAPPSPSKIQATIPDGSCDITWSEVLQLLSPLRNYEPTFLLLTQLQQDSRWAITEDTLQAIGFLRERTYMPHTFARDCFDSWHATKRQDDCLSVEQLHTVLHFLDILYTECYMAIEIRNLQDKTELLRHMTPASPDDSKALEDAMQGPFDDHTAKEIQTLQNSAMHLLRTMTRLPRHITSWAGRITEANRHFADLIFADSPVDENVIDEFIPMDPTPAGVADGTVQGRRMPTPQAFQRHSLPSTAAILGDPKFHSVITVTQGWIANSTHTVNFRMDGSSLGHPQDSGIAHEIRTRTLADKFTFWGQYLTVTGFYPTRTLETTLRDLLTTVARIGMVKGSTSTSNGLLLGDAQRLNIPLHDLVELDFQDGPA